MGSCLEGILFCQRFNPLSQYLWLPIDVMATYRRDV